jgi:hypothetical protein
MNRYTISAVLWAVGSGVILLIAAVVLLGSFITGLIGDGRVIALLAGLLVAGSTGVVVAVLNFSKAGKAAHAAEVLQAWQGAQSNGRHAGYVQRQ